MGSCNPGGGRGTSIDDEPQSSRAAVPSGSLEGKPNYGGELPYPHDWIDQCKKAANEKARWIVVPAIAGPLALLYLIGEFIAVVRRAKAEGRSTGALSGETKG